MSGSLNSKANAEPNLTPVLDMVFQLITFFMLVINFKANLIDRAMELPIVGTARPVDADKQKNRLQIMVNLNNKGQFTVYNKPIPDEKIADYIAQQAMSAKMSERRLYSDFDENGDLRTEVVIRADVATPFSKIYQVIKECQDNNFRSFAFRAMNKKKGT
jgi:biopolymer transport protein ExbD